MLVATQGLRRPRVGVERDGRGGAARACTGRRRVEPGAFPGYDALQALPHDPLWPRRTRARGTHTASRRGRAGHEVEANDDDVATGAKTLVFQVDDAPKGAKDGAELIRKGKTWSLK